MLERAKMLLHHASELESDARSEAGRHRRSGGGGVLSLPRADIDFREDTQNRLRMLLDSHDLDVAFLYDLDLEPGLETVTLPAPRVCSRAIPSRTAGSASPVARRR
ncbi:hypothetical protein [Rhodococcus pyridinivorans]|uniref:hypothetical protein n=1 Tax=Rhodococcus pyridinivorans TaxID=103816 RepID=UPI0035588EB1